MHTEENPIGLWLPFSLPALRLAPILHRILIFLIVVIARKLGMQFFLRRVRTLERTIVIIPESIATNRTIHSSFTLLPHSQLVLLAFSKLIVRDSRRYRRLFLTSPLQIHINQVRHVLLPLHHAPFKLQSTPFLAPHLQQRITQASIRPILLVISHHISSNPRDNPAQRVLHGHVVRRHAQHVHSFDSVLR